jgi:glycosyltransferase involved in cell wall biosynthesis
MHEIKRAESIRVLHIGPGWGQRGGIASVIDELKAFSGAFAAREVRVQFCETHGFKHGLGILNFLLKDVPHFVRQILANIDVVHLHVSVRGSFYRKFFLFLIARVLRKRVVFHLHAGNFLTFVRGTNRFARWCAEAMVRKSHAAVGVSHAIRDELVKLGGKGERLVVIGNSASFAEKAFGSALIRDAASVDAGISILFAGRLAETKGIQDILEAVAILKAQGKQVSVILAGSGDVNHWQFEAKRLSIHDHVSFPGWLEGEAKLASFRAATIFCMPSHYEAFGIATLEAMFAGLPVVGTCVGGFFDLVEDGRSGLLVEPSNPSSLARALLTLIDDASLIERMGRRGRERAFQMYSCSAITEGYVEMYRRIINRKG